jgi:hypothetical protein
MLGSHATSQSSPDRRYVTNRTGESNQLYSKNAVLALSLLFAELIYTKAIGEVDEFAARYINLTDVAYSIF